MSGSKCTYKCESCGERFKISLDPGKPENTPSCPVCGNENRKRVVPAYQYGSWGGPMAPELPKAYFG